VAIISDGNGRWALRAGFLVLRGTVLVRKRRGASFPRLPGWAYKTLTLFALSSANWKRPPAEVNAILRLLHEYLLTETSNCIAEGVRLSIIGRRDVCPRRCVKPLPIPEAALRMARVYTCAWRSITPRGSHLSRCLPLLQSHEALARFLQRCAIRSSARRLDGR